MFQYQRIDRRSSILCVDSNWISLRAEQHGRFKSSAIRMSAIVVMKWVDRDISARRAHFDAEPRAFAHCKSRDLTYARLALRKTLRCARIKRRGNETQCPPDSKRTATGSAYLVAGAGACSRGPRIGVSRDALGAVLVSAVRNDQRDYAGLARNISGSCRCLCPIATEHHAYSHAPCSA
jgi:hypothetical protein